MAKSSDFKKNDHTLVGDSSARPKKNAAKKSLNSDETIGTRPEEPKEDIEPTLNSPSFDAITDDREVKNGDSPPGESTEQNGGDQSSATLAFPNNRKSKEEAANDRIADTIAGDSKSQQSAPPPSDPNANTIDDARHDRRSAKKRAASHAKSPDPGYEILGELGRGAMGVVYKAKQKRLNRLVALKMVLSGSHAGAQDLARFQTEAEAVAKLTHPNIVQIYEVGESEGQPFFTLEFVNGGTLQQKFNGAPMKAADAAKLTQTLAHAVHYAHQRDIIHRDLKPANVLLTEDGVPKISDFGLAKDLGVDSQHTGSGAILGTPSYMAPEQAQGIAADIGPLSDVYALGAILYESLTGRPPFRGETVMETLLQVKNNDPVPPRRLQPKIPKDIETICLTCLRKEPHKRYASAEELATDLDRYFSGKPIKARPVSVVERLIKWARRRPGVAALLGVLAAVLIGGFILITTLWWRAEGLRKQADAAFLSAKQNAERAQKSADDATLQANKARIAEKAALASKNLAQKRYHESLRSFYLVSMNLAQNAFEQGKKGRLGELLFRHQKGGDDQDWRKLQGFEFDFLRRLHESDRLDLKEHITFVTDVAFRPRHPSEFATASGNGSIIIWNPSASDANKRYRRLTGHAKPVRSVAYHPKLNILASAGEDGVIHIWSLDDPAPKPKSLKGHTHWVTSIAFSPDGKRLVSGSEDQTVRLWDWQNGEVAATFTGHDYGVTQVAFGPRGQYVASASLDKTVRVWNLLTNKQELNFKRHQHWVSGVAFAPARDLVASASWDKKVIVWDASTGQELLTLDDCPSPARTLSFSPDGYRLAASCLDQSVVVWDLATKKLVRKLDAKKGVVRSVAFSEDGQRLASVSFDMLSQIVPALHDAKTSMLGVTFNKSGDRFAAAGDDSIVYLWDFAKSTMTAKLLGHTAPVRCVDFHPLQDELATGGEDNRIILWNLKDGSTDRRVLEGHKKWVTSLAYEPEGKWLVSGSADKSIRKWSLEGEPVVWNGHDDAVLSVAVSSDGKWIASGGADKKVILWDAQTGDKIVLSENGHEGLVTALAFSPDGKLLASGGSDNVVRIWDVESKKMTKAMHGHTQTVTCLAFHPTGKRLATGSKDRTVKIWDVALGHETLTLVRHQLGVTAVAFRPEHGRTLATAGWDQAVYLWQTKDAESVGH